MATFGQNLRNIRLARGLRSGEVAKRMGVSPSVVSAWEKGRRGLPESGTLLNLGRVIGCRVEALLADVDPEYTRQMREADLRGRLAELVSVAEALERSHHEQLIETLAPFFDTHVEPLIERALRWLDGTDPPPPDKGAALGDHLAATIAILKAFPIIFERIGHDVANIAPAGGALTAEALALARWFDQQPTAKQTAILTTLGVEER